jgi:hypothetical protein
MNPFDMWVLAQLKVRCPQHVRRCQHGMKEEYDSQIRHNHNIELLWFSDKLHRAVESQLQGRYSSVKFPWTRKSGEMVLTSYQRSCR